MLWFVYNVAFFIGYLLLLPHFVLRMRKRGGYRRHFLQRFGVYSPEIRQRLQAERHIWIHAVSVGEMFVALRFAEELHKLDDGVRILISTTTSTGHAIAEDRMSGKDVLIYFPTDLPFIVRRVLRIIQHQALILVDSELWPNMIRMCCDRDIPVMLVNGRISDSSYPGYRRARFLTRRVLQRMSLFLAQSDQDRERLIDLGAPALRVETVGSAKYDIVSIGTDARVAAEAILREGGIDPGDLILLGGSTWEGEEAALLDAYTELRDRFKGLRLVLVPRHMERREAVENEIRKHDLRYIKRSDVQAGTAPAVDGTDVLLVDTTGELGVLYSCASVVFVGKSLSSRGGQNFIEPAMFSKPIAVGPHLENFPVIADDFRKADAFVQVSGASELRLSIEKLLDSPEQRAVLGERACALVERGRGVVTRSVQIIARELGEKMGLQNADGASPNTADRDDFCAIVPAYHEAGRIGETVQGIRRFCRYVVVVDDGSGDGTAEEAEAAGAVVLRHSINQGKGVALATGFAHARKKGYEFALTMDGDGQHAAEDIPAFLKAYDRTKTAVLVGNRMDNPRTMPLVRRLTNRFMSWLLSRRMGQRVPDTQCGYRLYRCDVFSRDACRSERFAAESEVLLYLADQGVELGSVPVRIIYGEEKSKINPVVDTLRFFSMLRNYDRSKANRNEIEMERT